MTRRNNPYARYASPEQAGETDLADLLGLQPEEGLEEQSVPDSPETLSDDDLRQQAAERLCPSCPERAALQDERLRQLAEMENFKKRLQREQAEQARYAADKVLADLLPALDNMELALQYSSNEACKPILMGIEMTRKTLLDSLRRHGLETVGETGDVFDPLIHEAVGQEESADFPAGHVCKLMQRGYKLGDRLLRPARVVVSS